MKKLLLATHLVLFVSLSQAQNEESTQDTTKAKYANLDFSVPESPALKILGTDPDNILRPTSARSAAISIGNYLLTTGTVIPKSLAAEFSPLLANSKANLKQYNNHKFLYRSRISLGTLYNPDGSYSISEGLRLTIFDKSDLRADQSFLNKLADYAEKMAQFTTVAQRAYVRNHPNPEINNTNIAEKMDADPDLKKVIEMLADSIALAKMGTVPDFVEHLRDSVRNSLWNARIWEVAAAIVQTSPDSLIQNISQISRVDLWSTIGYPLGSQGQILAAFKFETTQNDSGEWKTNIVIGARLFFGSNYVRGYFQGQYENNDSKSIGVAHAGCEFNITNGLWADVGANLTSNESGKTSFMPMFSLKFGTPEKSH